MDTFTMIMEFKKNLIEHGLSYQVYSDNLYHLHHDGSVGQTIKVKLICSAHADDSEYGSRNGNNIQSIGVFKFKLSSPETDTDFFILGFASTTYQRIDFVIIPTEELKRRFIKKNRNLTANHRISIIFWLMDYRYLYDCTGVGVEWEWYYLSRGLNGRMVDGTEWDYSEFLNVWDRLKIV
jgi:hypothetical protein